LSDKIVNMKLEIKKDSINYGCSIVKIEKIFYIEGADNIQRVNVFGNNIVVSKNINEGDKMLYFVSGTKLSADYCHINNLYDKAEENLDTTKKGFISFRQKRVKAIKLKGVISDGMLMPLSSLDNLIGLDNVAKLKLGDEFTTINDLVICEKYIVPVRGNTQVGQKTTKTNKLKDLILDKQFHFHFETEHFVKHQNKFTQETEIIITRKIHGSSLILSNVLINKQLSFKDRVFNFFGANIPTSEYGIIWSSGKPKGKLPKGIESKTNKWETPNPSYYTSDIWAKAYKEIGHTVEKGISIYAEIVGKGIQGDLFTYNQDYGIYVYRITQTSIDGNVVEFSWEQLKKYCEKYGLNHVEEYFVGKVKEMVVFDDSLLGYLQQKYLNKSYNDCKIDEGICIRIRETDEIFKLKSPNFIKMESDNQENEVEEQES
jgi:tRNA-binding EMAP/Myf-like protein